MDAKVAVSPLALKNVKTYTRKNLSKNSAVVSPRQATRRRARRIEEYDSNEEDSSDEEQEKEELRRRRKRTGSSSSSIQQKTSKTLKEKKKIGDLVVGKNDEEFFLYLLVIAVIVLLLVSVCFIWVKWDSISVMVTDGGSPLSFNRSSRPFSNLPQSLSRGLLWMGPILSGGGYCSEAISFAIGLMERMPVRVAQHGDAVSQEFIRGLPNSLVTKLQQLFEAPIDVARSIVVCHSEAGAWYPPLYSTSSCPPEEGAAYTIGRTMFETDRIPSGWSSRCNHERMDEIWVPTQFHFDTFVQSGVNASKIVVIPESVDVDYFDPNAVQPLPKLVGYPTTKPYFKFLSIFKWEARKGWDILLKAYFSAFSFEDDVVLYLLTNRYHADGLNFEGEIKRLAASLQLGGKKLPLVHVLDNHLPQSQLPRLYKTVDAFVLPTRGEGWGRPLVEAMSMGLPVIATNWSGPTEFMTAENSYPLSIEGLVEITQGAFRGHKWAQPSQSHLQTLMRHVYENRGQAKAVGAQARADMVNHWNPKRVSEIAFARLVEIDSMLKERERETRRRAYAASEHSHVNEEEEYQDPEAEDNEEQLLDEDASSSWDMQEDEENVKEFDSKKEKERAKARAKARKEREKGREKEREREKDREKEREKDREKEREKEEKGKKKERGKREKDKDRERDYEEDGEQWDEEEDPSYTE